MGRVVKAMKLGTPRVEPDRIRSAWQGRICGCLLGKPLEVLSFREGLEGVRRYLQGAGAAPLRDYVPLLDGSPPAGADRACCLGQIERAEPDDDIDYTLLALLLLEEHGAGLRTEDVARTWLRLLPAGATWTAERAAYRTLLDRMAEQFVNGEAPGFDLAECADNEYSDWIGGQIRADLYGWVCPGRPALAADLARRDASLSHRGDGVHAAAFIAALAAALPACGDLDTALDTALAEIPVHSGAAEGVRFGRSIAGAPDAVTRLHRHYQQLTPLHAVNNLALVVWALCAHAGDFSATVGEAVAAGWDTDCNGATVGGLCALSGTPIDDRWTTPWQGRIGTRLAGHSELQLDKIVRRTVEIARTIA
jgi:ADP-ribosylglycohydrolase